MEQHILDEQIRYYRARAREYDETAGADASLQESFARAEELLRRGAPFERVLELASGTGTWTRVLLPLAREITAVDAAPEMLALAQEKLADQRVQYQQANLFQWEPAGEYDLVFFANWLSHVPPDKLAPFLARATRAVRAGGYLALLDQYAPRLEDRQIMQTGEDGHTYARRTLNAGESFTIVKMFYDLPLLQSTFAELGFQATLYPLDESFFFLEARRL